MNLKYIIVRCTKLEKASTERSYLKALWEEVFGQEKEWLQEVMQVTWKVWEKHLHLDQKPPEGL